MREKAVEAERQRNTSSFVIVCIICGRAFKDEDDFDNRDRVAEVWQVALKTVREHKDQATGRKRISQFIQESLSCLV